MALALVALALVALALVVLALGAGTRCERFEQNEVEFVIAHYSEDLDVLVRRLRAERPDSRVTVYSKGPTPPPGAHALPNVGREAHAYLHHIVERYDSLAGVTVFLHASAAGGGHKTAALDELLRAVRDPLAGPFACGVRHEYSEPDLVMGAYKGSTDVQAVQMSPASPRPFKAWYETHVGKSFPPPFWCLAGMFAVSGACVLARPREHYRRLLRELEAGGAAPEAGHYMERSWAGVFCL